MSALNLNVPVKPDSEFSRERKLIVISLESKNWRTLNELLAASRAKIPDMEMDYMVSAIMTEFCKNSKGER